MQELHGSPWFKPSAKDKSSAKSTIKSTSKTLVVESKASPQNYNPPSPDSPLTATPSPVINSPVLPEIGRRPSHDLFECIEQFKRLPEAKAKYVFAQVVDIVWYLHSMGIVHRDIKDENLVVDKEFKVPGVSSVLRGSVLTPNTTSRSSLSILEAPLTTIRANQLPFMIVSTGPQVSPRLVRVSAPRYSNLSSSRIPTEIIQGIPYLAAPAEIWTLGTLLSFLVTGETPFPPASSPGSKEAHIKGEIDMRKFSRVSPQCVDLLRGCLRPDPKLRFSIHNVR